MKLSLLALLWSSFAAYTSAEPAIHSSGPPSPCPGFQQTNRTTFDVSFTPDNSTMSFEASGLGTIMGNATFSFALFEDGEQVFLTERDPCLSVGSAELCPATGVPSRLDRTNLAVPEQFRTTISDNLPSTKNVTAELWVDVTALGGQFERTACFQTRLCSDDGSGGEGNSTSSTGPGTSSDDSDSTSDDSGSDGASDEGSDNSTSSGNGSDGASAGESGASVPRIAFSLVV
jgi:hypothetical protein